MGKILASFSILEIFLGNILTKVQSEEIYAISRVKNWEKIYLTYQNLIR